MTTTRATHPQRRLATALAVAVAALLVAAVLLLDHRGVGVFVVSSASMSPAVPTGSVILTVPAPSYRVGDAITFDRGDGAVTHRVVAVAESDRLVTRGDANPSRDPGSVAAADVHGRVALTVPLVGVAVVFLQQPSTLPALALLTALALLLPSTVRQLRTTRSEGAGCASHAA